MYVFRIGASFLGVLLAASCGEPAELARTVESRPHRLVVRMDDMTFDPTQATVAAGDTIVWINAGSLPMRAGRPSRKSRPKPPVR